MTTKTKAAFRLGDPQVTGPLAIYPVLGPPPRHNYLGLAHALKQGLSIREVGPHGNVRDVLVVNHSDSSVLIYEGEEILGARQNRTFDASVLVPAGVELVLPVSCVEAGRWDGMRAEESFTAAPQTADPELRRIKRTRSNASARAGRTPRAEQNEVWTAVAARLQVHGVQSNSSALSDLHDARRRDLESLRARTRPVEEQIGVVVEISGRPVAVDLVSRPEVFGELLPRLAEGYALQALGKPAQRPSRTRAERFLEACLAAERRWLPTSGMGEGFAVSQRDLEGAGLKVEGELVALCVFPSGKGKVAA